MPEKPKNLENKLRELKSSGNIPSDKSSNLISDFHQSIHKLYMELGKIKANIDSNNYYYQNPYIYAACLANLNRVEYRLKELKDSGINSNERLSKEYLNLIEEAIKECDELKKQTPSNHNPQRSYILTDSWFDSNLCDVYFEIGELGEQVRRLTNCKDESKFDMMLHIKNNNKIYFDNNPMERINDKVKSINAYISEIEKIVTEFESKYDVKNLRKDIREIKEKAEGIKLRIKNIYSEYQERIKQSS